MTLKLSISIVWLVRSIRDSKTVH